MSDDDGSYDIILRFDSAHPEFVRGVKAGRLLESFEQAVHANNAEMIMRMAEVTGHTYRAQDLDDEWISLVVDSHIEA